MEIDTKSGVRILQPTGSSESSLQPSDAVSSILDEGACLQSKGELALAAQRFAVAADQAASVNDSAGYGRAIAQLAALEESLGEIEEAHVHNRMAQETFLAIGDGAGLVQTFRVDGFLHLHRSDHTAAAHSFARALSLALQLDGRLVLTTLNQVLPVAKYLIESDQISGLLPFGAALSHAVESAEAGQPGESRDFAELAATVAGVLAPLGVMADEPELPAEKRRQLAARATHQAWLVDALTKRRWGMATLVKETLQQKLSFHEELD